MVKKRIVNKIVGYFQNKKTGVVVCEETGEEYSDGSFKHSVYDARYWVFLRDEKIPIKEFVKRGNQE